MKRGLLICGLAIAAALASATVGAGAPARRAAPAAAAWSSSWFVSPTHNIHCRWWGSQSLIACMTQNDDYMTGVTVYGRAFVRDDAFNYTFPSGPTLSYGEYWTAHNASGAAVVRCWSRSTGMTCRSLLTSRGFFISRESYRLYN